MADTPAPPDDWLQRLKRSVDNGYYVHEGREDGEPEHWPWQNKFCKDCPFWVNSICRVHAEYRTSTAHTCHYIQPAFHLEAQEIIAKRNLTKP